jgi:hypothetical protein
MNLDELIMDFSAVPDAELETKGRDAYKLHYLNQEKFGVHTCHDGEEVIFHEDQFGHAFFDKPDKWSLTKSQDLPDEMRLARMRWIGPLIRGEVAGSECWHVPSPTGRRRPPNRLYIAWNQIYVVWLEPKQLGGWKFSSAYDVVSAKYIREKYCRGGGKIWPVKPAKVVPRD